MLQAWLSIGYIILIAILVLSFILWRRGAPVLAIVALVVGIPLWLGWEYARPTWTTGLITGTEVRRRSEEHTSELQSLMRISYAVFCLKKKIPTIQQNSNNRQTKRL